MENLGREELDNLVDERIKYTVKYAAENSPFYRKWFRENNVTPADITTHEDLLELPIVTGETIRNNQPPETPDFRFKSVGWKDVYTVHETSGTSGVPKSFFLTWQDWQRYAQKYGRSFVSQNFNEDDRVIMCASYGMNVGANTMTLAARDIGMAIIPEGKCTFPPRIIESYQPTSVVASVFKLLRLAKRLRKQGIEPSETSINKMVVGGESFAEESRTYLEEVWDCPVYNTYGSTEGTMCGECRMKNGLHVPEDIVHLDVYDPHKKTFVKDGECGRIVLTTLLAPGEKCGSLLLNYDTEDTTVVVSRDKCECGRTHMRILNPEREAETFWVEGTPFNRVNVEKGVFQRDNMEYLTGEYEAFLYGETGNTTLRVSLECEEPEKCDREMVQENFLKSFLQYKPGLQDAYNEEAFEILFNFLPEGEMEFYKVKGRPKRVVDRR